jgi:hypothetical protein
MIQFPVRAQTSRQGYVITPASFPMRTGDGEGSGVKVLNDSSIELAKSVIIPSSRSQWPQDLRHELSSPVQTLGSWVRTPLEVWMFASVYSVLCRVGSGLALG